MGSSCVVSNICGLSVVSEESTAPHVKRQGQAPRLTRTRCLACVSDPGLQVAEETAVGTLMALVDVTSVCCSAAGLKARRGVEWCQESNRYHLVFWVTQRWEASEHTIDITFRMASSNKPGQLWREGMPTQAMEARHQPLTGLFSSWERERNERFKRSPITSLASMSGFSINRNCFFSHIHVLLLGGLLTYASTTYDSTTRSRCC